MELKVYTPQQVVKEKLLPLSLNRLRKALQTGEITGVRIGRKWLIPAWAIEELLHTPVKPRSN